MMRGGYFIQLAAYRAGIRWTYGVEVDSALLVVARQIGPAHVFHLDQQLLDECEAEFFHRLQLYQEANRHVMA